jgi:hypothetical protein
MPFMESIHVRRIGWHEDGHEHPDMGFGLYIVQVEAGSFFRLSLSRQ